MLAAVLFTGAMLCDAQTASQLRIFFRDQMGLSEGQIAMIARGVAVAKVLPSERPEEVAVVSAVFVKAAPEEYVKFAFDIDRLRRLPNYLGVGRFKDPPQVSDFEGFALEPEDIRRLATCRPGKCDVQLPAVAMQELQKSVDWASPDASAQVNERVRKMALELLQRYREAGNRALGIYRDREHPFDVNAELRLLLGRSEVLPGYLPELNGYLLDYPNAALASVDSSFYWERVNFGLKSTLRLNHAISYRSAGPKGAAHVVAVKQLYASHYFLLALDLTACVTESGRTADKGFYLISLKGSTQHGLTGFKGSLLRRVIVGKTRAAQESGLNYIRKALEGAP